MSWHPHPSSVRRLSDTGIGDMGDVTDETSKARFTLPEKFVLVFIKARFTGGAGSASLAVRLDHADQSGFYDFTEIDFDEAVGTGGEANLDFRVYDEYERYVYDGPDDVLVLTWMNPDPGNMRWAIEVGLAPVATGGA